MGTEIPQWKLVKTHDGKQKFHKWNWLKPMMGTEIPQKFHNENQLKPTTGTEIPKWELIKTHDGNRDSTMRINPQGEQQELVETHNGNRNSTMEIS